MSHIPAPPPTAAGPRRRSSLLPTVLAGLTTAGGMALAAGRTWAAADTRTPAARTVVASGTDVAPVVLPLALVALACWGAVLVLRRRGRRVVSVLGLAATTGGAVSAAARAHTSPAVARQLLASASGGAGTLSLDTTPWPVVTVVAGVLAAGAFLVGLRAAAGWPEMSSRYDAPAAAEPPVGEDPAAMWRALDEGRDPTG